MLPRFGTSFVFTRHPDISEMITNSHRIQMSSFDSGHSDKSPLKSRVFDRPQPDPSCSVQSCSGHSSRRSCESGSSSNTRSSDGLREKSRPTFHSAHHLIARSIHPSRALRHPFTARRPQQPDQFLLVFFRPVCYLLQSANELPCPKKEENPRPNEKAQHLDPAFLCPPRHPNDSQFRANRDRGKRVVEGMIGAAYRGHRIAILRGRVRDEERNRRRGSG